MNIKNIARNHGRKPTPLIYCLQSLQGRFCGIQFLINFLKFFRESNSFIFTGTISQILGPKSEGLLKLWYTVFTEGILKSQFFLKLYSCVVCVKISVTTSQDYPCFISNISAARLYMFLWWTDTGPSFSKSSS